MQNNPQQFRGSRLTGARPFRVVSCFAQGEAWTVRLADDLEGTLRTKTLRIETGDTIEGLCACTSSQRGPPRVPDPEGLFPLDSVRVAYGYLLITISTRGNLEKLTTMRTQEECRVNHMSQLSFFEVVGIETRDPVVRTGPHLTLAAADTSVHRDAKLEGAYLQWTSWAQRNHRERGRKLSTDRPIIGRVPRTSLTQRAWWGAQRLWEIRTRTGSLRTTGWDRLARVTIFQVCVAHEKNSLYSQAGP